MLNGVLNLLKVSNEDNRMTSAYLVKLHLIHVAFLMLTLTVLNVFSCGKFFFLNYSTPMFSFYIPCKPQKSKGPPIFSGGMEHLKLEQMEHLREMVK